MHCASIRRLAGVDPRKGKSALSFPILTRTIAAVFTWPCIKERIAVERAFEDQMRQRDRESVTTQPVIRASQPKGVILRVLKTLFVSIKFNLQKAYLGATTLCSFGPNAQRGVFLDTWKPGSRQWHACCLGVETGLFRPCLDDLFVDTGAPVGQARRPVIRSNRNRGSRFGSARCRLYSAAWMKFSSFQAKEAHSVVGSHEETISSSRRGPARSGAPSLHDERRPQRSRRGW